MNERFTALADRISEWLGLWWFSVGSLVLVGAWTAYGAIVLSRTIPDWFSSTQWGIPINDLTTIGEWFIGCFLASAANRVEKHNRALQESHREILARLEALLRAEQGEIQAIEAALESKT